jgi:hypothetical protein
MGGRIMGALTYRAERALLSAMLCEPGLAAALDSVEPADFTSRQHRMVHHAAMMASRSAGQDGAEWRDLIARAAAPELSPYYLGELRATCPDPRHGPAYAKMVLEASVLRALRGHAADLARHADLLGRHMADIASAMHRQAARFNPDTTSAVTGPPAAAGGPGREEELVLAALIRQHPETGPVVSMLPAVAFGDPLRREAFETIRTLYRSRRDIDPLTVDWELARRAPAAIGPGEWPAAGDQPSYVMRLAVSAARGPVARTAYALLARHAASDAGPHPSAGGAAPRPPVTGSTARPGTKPGQQEPPRLMQPPPHMPGHGHGHTQRM